MADNLIQKRGESTWYVRLAVPADVQQKLGCKVLVQSLRTGMRGEAMTRRLPILYAWKEQIKAVRAGTPLPPDWRDSLADTLATAALITRANKMVSIGEEPSYPFPMPDPAEVARSMEENPELVQALKAKIAKAHQTPMGLIKLDEEMGEMFKRLMVHRYETAYTPTPEQREEIHAIATDPASVKPRSPITPARLKAYREFRQTRPGSLKHIEQQVAKMERFGDFLKETGLSLNFDTVDGWLTSLNRAPATLHQYLVAGAAYWKWAMKYNAGWRDEFKGHADPFKGHVLPSGGGSATAGEKRKVYSVKDLEKLHKGAVAAGNGPLADLILLGAYTGSRIEQLCQLKVEHVIDQDGIQSFDFIGGKNAHAIRVVPVHPALKAVVARLIKDSSDGFLIPTASKNKHRKRSHDISREFGVLRTALGFGPLYVFHGLRNTVITTLARADVQGPLIAEIVGHSTGTITFDVYARGASAKQKYDAISKLPTLII
jgi:integrase